MSYKAMLLHNIEHGFFVMPFHIGTTLPLFSIFNRMRVCEAARLSALLPSLVLGMCARDGFGCNADILAGASVVVCGEIRASADCSDTLRLPNTIVKNALPL